MAIFFSRSASFFYDAPINPAAQITSNMLYSGATFLLVLGH